MSNRGREKECRKESVPEDSRWAVFFFFKNYTSSQVEFTIECSERKREQELGPVDGLWHASKSCYKYNSVSSPDDQYGENENHIHDKWEIS